MVDANFEVLQAGAQRTFGLDVNGALQRAVGINQDVNGICRALWGKEANDCFDEMRFHLSNHFLLPFLGGITTPDHASFAVTDLDVRVLVKADDWTPASTQHFIGQNPGPPNNAWVASGHANGTARLALYPDGTNIVGAESTVPLGFRNGTAHWVRMTVDVNDGAGNHVLKYYTTSSPNDSTNWVQIGTTITTAGVTSIFNSTGAMTVPGLAGFSGFFYAAEVRNGIGGTIIANPDVRNLAPGTTSFTDGAGRLWTLTGLSAII
jgi:hypothetical protein